jgi:hypothetical protein
MYIDVLYILGIWMMDCGRYVVPDIVLSFWAVMQCGHAGSASTVEKILHPNPQNIATTFTLKVEAICLLDVGEHVQDHTASQSRSPKKSDIIIV